MITLLGLGADPYVDIASSDIDDFLLRSPRPTSGDVANFLKLFTGGAERNAAARALVARGVPAGTISSALTFLNTSGGLSKASIWGAVSVASAAYSGYHGMRRNDSMGWGAWWFLMGGIFPVAAPLVTVWKNKKALK